MSPGRLRAAVLRDHLEAAQGMAVAILLAWAAWHATFLLLPYVAG